MSVFRVTNSAEQFSSSLQVLRSMDQGSDSVAGHQDREDSHALRNYKAQAIHSRFPNRANNPRCMAVVETLQRAQTERLLRGQTTVPQPSEKGNKTQRCYGSMLLRHSSLDVEKLPQHTQDLAQRGHNRSWERQQVLAYKIAWEGAAGTIHKWGQR